MYSIIKKVKNMSAIFKNLCYNYCRTNERGNDMPKIHVKTTLTGDGVNHKVESKGILQKHKILYQESDLKVTVEIQDDKVILYRDCKDYNLMLPFALHEKTNGIEKMKQFPLQIDAVIDTKEMIIKDKEITIIYDLTFGGEFLGEYHYHLIYEVIK